MRKQPTPIKIWHSMADANVELFRARMNFSAEMFDLYTQWPRKSFNDMAEALKAAHLESLKVLAGKSEKRAARPAAKPAVKAKAAPKKKAKAALKPKAVAAEPEAKPKPEQKGPVETLAPEAVAAAAKPVVEPAKPAVKAGVKPVTLPDMPDFSAKPRPTPPVEAPKPAETPEKDS